MWIVWQRDEFQEGVWYRKDCETERQVQETILERMKSPGEIVVTQPLEYKLDIKLMPAKEPKAPAAEEKRTRKDKPTTEEGKSAAETSQAGSDQNTGD